jgi:hypothetical protein
MSVTRCDNKKRFWLTSDSGIGVESSLREPDLLLLLVIGGWWDIYIHAIQVLFDGDGVCPPRQGILNDPPWRTMLAVVHDGTNDGSTRMTMRLSGSSRVDVPDFSLDLGRRGRPDKLGRVLSTTRQGLSCETVLCITQLDMLIREGPGEVGMRE